MPGGSIANRDSLRGGGRSSGKGGSTKSGSGSGRSSSRNPEDYLWGIGERKWFEGQVKTFGLDKAREHLQEEIDAKENKEVE